MYDKCLKQFLAPSKCSKKLAIMIIFYLFLSIRKKKLFSLGSKNMRIDHLNCWVPDFETDFHKKLTTHLALLCASSLPTSSSKTSASLYLYAALGSSPRNTCSGCDTFLDDSLELFQFLPLLCLPQWSTWSATFSSISPDIFILKIILIFWVNWLPLWLSW